MSERDQSIDFGPILISGASGFIGRELVRTLREAGLHPRAMARSAPTARALTNIGAEVARGTLANPQGALEGVRTVVNLAHDFRASSNENVAQFEAFLAACLRAGVEHLVHASSVVVHRDWPRESLSETSALAEDPAGSGYRWTKIEIEQRISEAVKDGALASATILRPTLVYGVGSRFWTTSIVERLRGGPIVLPEAPEDLPKEVPFGLCHCLHVGDLADALTEAVQRPPTGVRICLLSDPNPPTWKEFYSKHSDILGFGAIRMAPFAELGNRLPPVAGEVSEDTPGVGAKVSSALRQVIGNEPVERIGRWLRSRNSNTSAEQYPDRFLFDLYTSRGRMNTSLAAADLGFAPRKSIDLRLQEMADDLRRLI